MSVTSTLKEINDDVKTISSNGFDVEATDAYVLPTYDDQGITFENLDTKAKKAKFIKTCVLHIDLRESTKINFEKKPETLSKLYSSFIRGAIKCADNYNGKVRGIAGDRIMILFDAQNCFENAVNTAILLYTFSNYILYKYFQGSYAGCGIGIDYGKMLAMKVGTVKQGLENTSYKALVWLGPTANVASKLADIAGKKFDRPVVSVARRQFLQDAWDWRYEEIDSFFNGLEDVYSVPGIIARFKDPSVVSFFKSVAHNNYQSILMSDRVYNGFRDANPKEKSIEKSWWKRRSIYISGNKQIIYGGDIHFSYAKQLT